jgi:hypothetical protein
MHLSETEAIEAAEETLTPERAAHAASCERCRLVVERLSATLHEARALDVPEPSPTFWNAFPARVLDAIDDDAIDDDATDDASAPASIKTSWRFLAWRPALASAAVLVVLIIVATVAIGVVRRSEVDVQRDDSARRAIPPALEPAETLEADPEWMLLTSIADGIEWDTADAAGLGLRPGSAERAAEQLSREEQLELERLIRVEVGGSSGAI